MNDPLQPPAPSQLPPLGLSSPIWPSDIPESFNPLDQKSIRQCLFGQLENIQLAVLTPSRSLFSRLGTTSQFTAQQGWWPSLYRHGAIIVLTPQGGPIMDAISALAVGTRIIFLGIAGALRELSVGDIVEPEIALYQGKCYFRNFPTPPAFPSARIATVSCLATSMHNGDLLAQQAECVDLETALIYAAAAHQNKLARSIQVISDDSSQTPFFNAKLTPIEASIMKVTSYINAYIDSEFH
jgi:hypothetical protein